MRKARIVGTVVLVNGLLLVMLGLVHLGAAFFEFGKARRGMGASFLAMYMAMFCVSGVFFSFLGLLDLLMVKALKARMAWAWKLALLSAGFTSAIGVAGVVILHGGPPLVFLVTGLAGLAALLSARKAYFEQREPNLYPDLGDDHVPGSSSAPL